MKTSHLCKLMGLLLVLGVLSCNASSDPCAGQDGTCLTIDVQGQIAGVDALSFALSGAVQHNFSQPLPAGVSALPVLAGVLLPQSAAGSVQIHGVALLKGQTVAQGAGTVIISAGAHASTVLTLSAVTGCQGASCPCRVDPDCQGTPATPHCNVLSGRCVACNSASDCASTPLTPICDNDTRTCVQCNAVNSAACSAATPQCLTASKRCVQCLATSDCDATSASSCLATNACGCNGGAQCAAGAPVCDSSLGCVQCNAAHKGLCTGAYPACVQGRCAQCATNADCSAVAGTPRCDSTINACVQCLAASDCVSRVCQSGACQALFGAPTNFAVGSSPTGVASGDFNGDGKLDLVATNSAAGTSVVSVLLGAGNGTFGAATSISAGGSQQAVGVADLNVDGKRDIIAAAGTGAGVLLGLGNGGFNAVAGYATGNLPWGLAVGDLNGDGKPDVVVTNYITNNLSVLLNSGAGVLGAASSLTAGNTPTGVAIGDLNGDTKADLVVCNRLSNNVSILLGNGNGTFQAASNFAAGTEPFGVALTDLNNDGKLDVVSANGNGSVTVQLGSGMGTLGAAVTYTGKAGSLYRSIAVADVNGDGLSDLVVADQGASAVAVFISTGSGSFIGPLSYAAGSSAMGVALGDYNGDGKSDLAVANYGTNNISILLHQ